MSTIAAAAASAAQQSIQQAGDSITTLVPLQFATLAAIRQARVNLLQRQAAALKTVAGTTASDTMAVQNSIAFQQLSLARFGAVNIQAATPAPVVPAGGWVLHGRVRDANLNPLPKLTVTLTDQEKAWQTPYGYAFTDVSGYFVLPYTPPAPSPTPGPAPSSAGPAGTAADAKIVVPAASAPSTAMTSPAATAPAAASPTVAPTGFYLQICNETGQPVYFDAQAFTLTPGVALYRDIANVSTQPLGTPPVGAAEAPGAPK